MNKLYKTKYYLLFLILFTFFGCDKLKQVDRVIKKSFGQINRFERQKNNYSNRLGLNKQKNNQNELNISDTTNNYNSITQKNLINDHGYLFEIINGVDPGKIIANPVSDDNEMMFVVNDTSSTKIAQNLEVFGWHPHWMGDNWKNYYFNLLSTVSFFSYKIDPETGFPQNPSELSVWNDSDFVSTAKSNGTRVLLTISLHGEENVVNFLETEEIHKNLFITASDYILSKNADGVDINFENVPYSQVDNYKKFIINIKNFLKNEFYKDNLDAESVFMSMTLPASKVSENYSIAVLEEYIDLYVIMGYDLHSDKIPGATAPLQSENDELSLLKVLQRFDKFGINKNKTILALPYYGLMYDIEAKSDASDDFDLVPKLDRKLTYNEINKFFIENEDLKYEVQLDPISMSRSISILFDDNSMKEIFYDDSFTLSEKYNFAMTSGLKGVGIWALGYDDKRKDLWGILENNFTSNDVIYENPISKVNGFPIRFAKSLVKDKDIYFVIIIFLTFSVIISGILLLSDWRFRKKISEKKINIILLFTIFYVFLIPLVIFINSMIYADGYGIYLSSEFNLYIAFFLGLLVYYLGSKITIKKEQKP